MGDNTVRSGSRRCPGRVGTPEVSFLLCPAAKQCPRKRPSPPSAKYLAKPQAFLGLSSVMDLAPVGLHWTVNPLGTSIALCLPYGDVNLSTASAVWIITSLQQSNVSFRCVMVRPQHRLLGANTTVNLEWKRMVGQLGGSHLAQPSLGVV